MKCTEDRLDRELSRINPALDQEIPGLFHLLPRPTVLGRRGENHGVSSFLPIMLPDLDQLAVALGGTALTFLGYRP